MSPSSVVTRESLSSPSSHSRRTVQASSQKVVPKSQISSSAFNSVVMRSSKLRMVRALLHSPWLMLVSAAPRLKSMLADHALTTGAVFTDALLRAIKGESGVVRISHLSPLAPSLMLASRRPHRHSSTRTSTKRKVSISSVRKSRLTATA